MTRRYTRSRPPLPAADQKLKLNASVHIRCMELLDQYRGELTRSEFLEQVVEKYAAQEAGKEKSNANTTIII